MKQAGLPFKSYCKKHGHMFSICKSEDVRDPYFGSYITDSYVFSIKDEPSIWVSLKTLDEMRFHTQLTECGLMVTPEGTVVVKHLYKDTAGLIHIAQTLGYRTTGKGGLERHIYHSLSDTSLPYTIYLPDEYKQAETVARTAKSTNDRLLALETWVAKFEAAASKLSLPKSDEKAGA